MWVPGDMSATSFAPARLHPPVVVASVPAGHVYVRHIAPEDGGGIDRLPDPDPDDARRVAEQRWWPPLMLNPAWVAGHDFDLMHLHFGFDARAPEDLQALVDALRERGRPLVYTVHDLRNPHHETAEAHDAQLDVLVPAADRLITLTAGARDEIRRRWGRKAVVLPHPHVVPLSTMGRLRAQRSTWPRGPEERSFRVGLHVKSLRPSMDPSRLLPTLVDTVRSLPRAVLQVNAHRDVMTPGSTRHDPDLAGALRDHADAGRLELKVHDYLSDEALWTYLASLDVSVLPYRFGTHSGWLEACRDLGTAVVAPSCGYFQDQGPVLTYGHDEAHFDEASLVRALRDAYGGRLDEGGTAEERRRQRHAVAAGHDHVYRSLA